MLPAFPGDHDHIDIANPRPGWRDALVVFCIVFAAALAGILMRPLGLLASFWPANAILLGLLVRHPPLARPLIWLAAACGYLVADLVTGASLITASWLALANFANVVTGFLLYRRLDPPDRLLRRPLSVLYLFLISTASAGAGALVGGPASAWFFDQPLLGSIGTWFAGELANNIVMLPVVLSAPVMGILSLPRPRFRHLFHLEVARIWPLLALALSVLVATLVGGPGAIAIPIPALLWCALTYSVFTTVTLVMVFSLWEIIVISAGLEPGSNHNMVSIRLGLGLLALGPLTVGSVNAAHNDLLKTLERTADHDFLTDALTRRAFATKGEALLVQRAAHNQPLTALMLDIDNFKPINDLHGHAGGDRVIAEVAEILRGSLRETDLLGRIGGEEFAILLSDTPPADGIAVAERIRATIAAARIPLPSGVSVSVTVSIGIAQAAPGATQLESLLAAADKALYEAKRGGRNRVQAAPARAEAVA